MFKDSESEGSWLAVIHHHSEIARHLIALNEAGPFAGHRELMRQAHKQSAEIAALTQQTVNQLIVRLDNAK